MKERLTSGDEKKEVSEKAQNTKNKRPADAALRARRKRQNAKKEQTNKESNDQSASKTHKASDTGKPRNVEPQSTRPTSPEPKKKIRVKRKLPLIILGIVLLIVVMIWGGRSFYNAMLEPVSNNTESIIVEIPEGSTIKDVSTILYDEGVIKNTMVFESYAGRNSRGVSGIQAAEYEFNKSMSVSEIFTKMVDGDSYHGPIGTIVIPEGRNIKEMAPIIEASGICSAEEFIAETQKVDKYKTKYAILGSIPSGKDRTLEGYLFPDTYHLKEKSKVEDIVVAMLNRFVEVYNKTYLLETKNQGKSVDEIVIMGSIIELETKLLEDKADASSVFYNRIAADIALQSDITVDYARGEKTPVLTKEQTQFDSPYNTYLYKGLPLGPIGSPGVTSLDAALHPSETKYLFFVADMATGKLYFNETLEGHDQDVLTYMGQ